MSSRGNGNYAKHQQRVTDWRRSRAVVGKVAAPPSVPMHIPLPKKPGPVPGWSQRPVTLSRVKWLERPDP